MLVLGIDPGSHRTGWGLLRAEGSRLGFVEAGVIRTGDGELPARLLTLGEALDALLATHRPAAIAVENIFHAKNAQSALLLGQARGVALLCAARSGATVCEYTPGEIKQATTGRGRADKEQVQQMVRLILGVPREQALALDASDALAVALCHAQRGALTRKLRAVGSA